MNAPHRSHSCCTFLSCCFLFEVHERTCWWNTPCLSTLFFCYMSIPWEQLPLSYFSISLYLPRTPTNPGTSTSHRVPPSCPSHVFRRCCLCTVASHNQVNSDNAGWEDEQPDRVIATPGVLRQVGSSSCSSGSACRRCPRPLGVSSDGWMCHALRRHRRERPGDLLSHFFWHRWSRPLGVAHVAARWICVFSHLTSNTRSILFFRRYL